MSERAERVAPAAVNRSSRTRVEEVVVGFDPELLKAPFLLRCGAFLIDYILFISVPVIALIIGRFLGFDGAKLLNNEMSGAGWLIAFLVAVSNFIIFPMLTGHSVGKLLTGLQIVRADGQPATFWNLLIRHLPGYLLTALTLGLGFLFSVFNKQGRSLHDLLAGTVVVYGKRRAK